MPTQELNLYKLPKEVVAEDLADITAIVIDLLRATTTICYALAAGAKEVVPFREIDEARAAANRAGSDEAILAGERRGLLIDGFDLGNSPAEFTPDRVAGRRVFLTTTNGTQALHHARMARRVIVGAAVNLSAIVASVKNEPRVAIVCAGTDGNETLEDILAAGAMVEKLTSSPAAIWKLNDAAIAAAREWRLLAGKADISGRPIHEQFALALRDTLGGRNCIEVGNGADLPDCAAIDRFQIIPELDVPNWKITASHSPNTSR
jgi:2-phosphosulfolactate phosphatase